LLIAMGKKTASEILAKLPEDEVKEISYWINRMPLASAELTKSAVEEFYARLHGTNKASYQGGKEYLFDLLSESVGEAKAKSIIQNLNEPTKKESPVKTILNTADPKQLAEFMGKENPQTIALILYRVDPSRAAKILSEMNLNRQTAIITALAEIEDMDHDSLQVLLKKTAETFGESPSEHRVSHAISSKAAAAIFKNLPKNAQSEILAKIEEKNPALATKITNFFFVFDELLILEEDQIKAMVEACNPLDLVLALSDCDEALKSKFLRHIPKSKLENINRQILSSGPTTAFTVQSAQRKIATVIQQLQGTKR
jgi:flagellar motor switch protein FliG